MSARKSDLAATDTNTADRELVVTRVVNAPREAVFDAFTNRQDIGLWWGPNDFKTTTYEMDVRPGGVWRFSMRGPDGTDYPNRVVYKEIVRPERMVYEHDSGIDNDPQRFLTTLTLEAQGQKTKVTLRALFPSAAQFEEHKKFGAIEGGNQTLARLDAYLVKNVRPTM